MRTLLIIFCLLFVFNISYAQRKEFITFNIYHTPPPQLLPDRDFDIEITIYEPENVSSAFLSYRRQGEHNYQIIFLKRKGAIFSGKIPSSEIKGEWIEYFISVIDALNEVRPVFYNDKKPYRVSIMRKNPEIIEVTSLKEKRESLSSLYAKSYLESPMDIIIIDREGMYDLYMYSIPELLRNLDGLDVRFFEQGFYRTGIRGFGDRNNQVMVRIDGRKVNFPGYGATFWQAFIPEGGPIEKIEVIKGPGSYLYGANASGGVIDITTGEFTDTFNGRFAAGNFHSLSVYSSGGVKYKSISTGFFAGHSQVNYFEDPNRKAASNEAISLRTHFTPSYNIKLTLTGGYTKSAFPLFTNFGDYTAGTENSYVLTQLNFNKFYFRSYWNEDNLYSIKPSGSEIASGPIFKSNIFPVPIRTDDFRVESGYSYPTGDWNTLTAGGEGAITVNDAESTGEPRFTEKSAGAFLLDEIKPFEKLIFTLSYRFDWSSIHDPGNSSLLGLTILPSGESSIKISAREGFRVPSYLEYINSEKNLINETINTTQIDYYRRINTIDFKISLYYNKIRNLIDFSPEDNRFVNAVNKIEVYGTELGVEFPVLKRFKFFTNYSFSKTSRRIKSNPSHRANGGIIFKKISNLNGAFTLNYTSSYTEEIFLNEILSNVLGDYTVNQVKPYLLLNFKLSYLLFRNSVEIGLNGSNILFKRHFESNGITMIKEDQEVVIGGQRAGTRVEGFITGKF